MLDSQLPAAIRLPVSPQDLNLKSGDIVLIQVIKKLTESKWAIGFQGRVYPAVAEIELQPGQTLRVKVLKSGETLQFKIAAQTADTPVLNFLKTQGIPSDGVTQQIVAALMRSEMAIIPEMVQRIRNRLLKEDKPLPALIRLLVSVLGKGIKGTDAQLEPLLGLLDYGSQDPGQQDSSGRRHPAKPPPEVPRTSAELEEYIREVTNCQMDSGDNLLQLFNHLPGGQDSWVVIPYRFEGGVKDITGTLRLLLTASGREVKKGVLIVHVGPEEKWSFFIDPEKNSTRVMVFSNKRLYIDKKSGSFKTLRTNLENIGVKLDDIIYSDKDFDGFFPINQEPGYKSVNTII